MKEAGKEDQDLPQEIKSNRVRNCTTTESSAFRVSKDISNSQTVSIVVIQNTVPKDFAKIE